MLGGILIQTGTSRFYPPSNVTLRSTYLSVGGTPSTGNTRVDIKKNGTSTLNIVNVQVGNYVSANYSMADAPLTTTDYLTVDTVAGSGASNGSLVIVYTIDNNPTL
jgi:hypothetical protein